MKFLLNLKFMRALGILFQLVPDAGHLSKGWQLGYTLLKALYDFVTHLQGAPTAAQLETVLDEAAEQAMAETPAPVPAQAPAPGPVSDSTVAPRSSIEPAISL